LNLAEWLMAKWTPLPYIIHVTNSNRQLHTYRHTYTSTHMHTHICTHTHTHLTNLDQLLEEMAGVMIHVIECGVRSSKVNASYSTRTQYRSIVKPHCQISIWVSDSQLHY